MRDDTLILCYHAVSAEWPSELAVTPEALRDQVRHLLAQGYRATTFTEAALSPPAGRSLAVTFDDAYESVFQLARPVLAELGVPATLFVPTDFPESGVPFPLPGAAWIGTEYEPELLCMGWDEVRRLRDEGWEIGSHTCSHPWLTRLPQARLAEELARSGEILAERLGEPCRSIAYPYGDHDDRVVAATAASGYEAACTTPHRFERYESGPLRYGRIDVTRSESARAFRLRTAAWSRRARTTSAARAAHWLDTHRPHRASVLAKTRAQRHRLSRARALKEACSNWRRLVADQLAGRPLLELRLRDGVDLRFARPAPENAERFDAVFVEPAYTRHFEVGPGDVVVDVGAGEGLFAARCLQQGCERVVCFEADPALAAALRDNVERNRLDRIAVEGSADGATPGLEAIRAAAAGGIGLLKLTSDGAGEAILAASGQTLDAIDRIVAGFDPSVPGPRIDEIVARLRQVGFETWLDVDPASDAGLLSARRR